MNSLEGKVTSHYRREGRARHLRHRSISGRGRQGRRRLALDPGQRFPAPGIHRHAGGAVERRRRPEARRRCRSRASDASTRWCT